MSMFPNNKTVLFSLCILLYCRAILITRVLSTIVRCLGGPLSQQTAGSQRGPSIVVERTRRTVIDCDRERMCQSPLPLGQ